MSPSNENLNATQVAKIAVYDDLLSAPRVVEIQPSDVASYIEGIASNTYQLASQLGGSIPYTVIREVSENFIHAQFKEITVSIMNGGNTIRFADQGPGIENKDRAQMPGFSSASANMRDYIRGVGSGLPIVKEYLKFSNGRLVIEDNIKDGTVITIGIEPASGNQPVVYQEAGYYGAAQAGMPGATVQAQYAQGQGATFSAGLPGQGAGAQANVNAAAQYGANPAMTGASAGVSQTANGSMAPQHAYGQQPGYVAGVAQPADPAMVPAFAQAPAAAAPVVLDERDLDVLAVASELDSIGPTDLSNSLNIPTATAYRILKKLQDAGYLMDEGAHKGKRVLTRLGLQALEGQV